MRHASPAQRANGSCLFPLKVDPSAGCGAMIVATESQASSGALVEGAQGCYDPVTESKNLTKFCDLHNVDRAGDLRFTPGERTNNLLFVGCWHCLHPGLEITNLTMHSGALSALQMANLHWERALQRKLKHLSNSDGVVRGVAHGERCLMRRQEIFSHAGPPS